jgi:hypothetical protein
MPKRFQWSVETNKRLPSRRNRLPPNTSFAAMWLAGTELGPRKLMVNGSSSDQSCSLPA